MDNFLPNLLFPFFPFKKATYFLGISPKDKTPLIRCHENQNRKGYAMLNQNEHLKLSSAYTWQDVLRIKLSRSKYPQRKLTSRARTGGIRVLYKRFTSQYPRYYVTRYMVSIALKCAHQ